MSALKVHHNTLTLSTGTELCATSLTPFNREEFSPFLTPGPMFNGEVGPGRFLTLAERAEIGDYMKARWDAWVPR